MAEQRLRRGRPGTWAALLVGLVALLAAAAVATAEAKLTQQSSRSSEIAATEQGSTRALCPGGARRHLISGGFASNSPWRADANSTIAAIGSLPAGKRGWRMDAANFAGEPETITASALCAKHDPRVRISEERVRVGPGGVATATARCRAREEAIAGGFSTPRFRQDRGPEVVAVASRRDGPRRWLVSAYNNSASEPGKLLVYARCAKRRPRLKTIKLSGAAVDQAAVTLKPRCDPGTELWSGGFEAGLQSFEPFAAIIADRSYADGRAWVSRFVGYQARGEVSAWAYCAPRR